MPLFNEDETLNEEVPVEKIREYVYFSETKHPLQAKKENKGNDNDYFLDKHDETAYYFFYEKEDLTTLDHDFLATIKTPAS